MTWWRGESHYEVFFNRDELKTRSRAEPPTLHRSRGVRFLSPRDPDAGGTWMMVNERGLTLCLLNRWHENDVCGGIKSRGQLVLDFAGMETAQDVMAQLKRIDCTDYKPFTLVAIDRGEEKAMAWDGVELCAVEASQPQTSSSFCFHEVKRARCLKYDELLGVRPEFLREYQAGEEKPSAFTVRMNRPDAQTWSRSHVCVFENRITWEYVEEMPDLAAKGVVHQVDLNTGL